MIKLYKISNVYLILIILGVLYSFISQNIMLSLFSFVTLYFLFALLWKPNETPVVFLAMVFQWLQVSTKIFEANFAEEDIDKYALSSMSSTVVFYGFLALLVISLGLNYSINKKSKVIRLDHIWEEASMMSALKSFEIFIYYVDYIQRNKWITISRNQMEVFNQCSFNKK